MEQSSACSCSEVAEGKASVEQLVFVAVVIQGFSRVVELAVFRLLLVACAGVEPIVGESVEQRSSVGVASQVGCCDRLAKVLSENDHRFQGHSTDLPEYLAGMQLGLGEYSVAQVAREN